MAGSYAMLLDENGDFTMDLIDDIGDAEEALRECVKRVAKAREDALEEAARCCVRRSCTWSAADDADTEDFRRGIEHAAGQLAQRIRALKSKEPTDD